MNYWASDILVRIDKLHSGGGDNSSGCLVRDEPTKINHCWRKAKVLTFCDSEKPLGKYSQPAVLCKRECMDLLDENLWPVLCKSDLMT